MIGTHTNAYDMAGQLEVERRAAIDTSLVGSFDDQFPLTAAGAQLDSVAEQFGIRRRDGVQQEIVMTVFGMDGSSFQRPGMMPQPETDVDLRARVLNIMRGRP